MRFSVIVPIYKVADYLDDCVQSVKNQTYTDWELILVDDGSPDACPQMCDGYAKEDARIRVIHKENGGASEARNAGIEQAKGEYVLLLDGDDFYNRSDMFEMLSANIDKSGADVILFGCTDWNMKTGEKRISRSDYDLHLLNQVADREQSLHYLLSQKKIPGGPTIFTVQRALLDEYGIRFHCGIQSEDHEYVLMIFSHCKQIFAMDEPFYTYRLSRDGSVTQMNDIKAVQGITYTVKKWFPIFLQEPNEILRQDFLNYLAFIYTTGFVVSGRMKPAMRKQAIAEMKSTRYILQYGYWKKTKVIRACSALLGPTLFSVLAVKYFALTHPIF